MKPRRESEIQTEILYYLRLVPNVVAWKSGSGAFRATYKGKERFVRMGKKGAADITGWRRTKAFVQLPGTSTAFTVNPQWIAQRIEIEVKQPGKKCTPEQGAFLEEVACAGGIAFVATSVDDVRRVFPLPKGPLERREAPKEEAR